MKDTKTKFPNKRNNKTELIKSHITPEDLNENPVILDLIKKKQRLRFSSLTMYKPKLIPIKGINNKNTEKLINNVNSFRKIFFDYNKNKKYPKNDIKPYDQKYNFQEKYKEFKNNTKKYFSQKDMLEEIETKYKNNDISLPSIEEENKNIFKDNILLSKDKNIKDFISYNLGSEKSDKKSFIYLNKMQKVLTNQIIGKMDSKMSNITYEIKKDISWSKNFFMEEQLDKSRLIKNEISKSQNDINSTKNLMKVINDIDYFFDVNNKKYLVSLKNKGLKKKSKIKLTKRIFKSTCFSLPKSHIKKLSMNSEDKNNINDIDNNNNDRNNNQDIINNNGITNNNNINDNIKSKIEVNEEDKKNNTNNKSIISDNSIKISKNQEKNYKNSISNISDNSFISILNKEKKLNLKSLKNRHSVAIVNLSEFTKNYNNLIKIKKINLNEKKDAQNLNQHDSNNITLSTLPQNSTYDKILKPYSSKYRKEESRKVAKKNLSSNNGKSEVEKLYDTIKNGDDSLQFNSLIQKYLKNQNYNIEPKISPNDINENYQRMRDKICKNDCIGKNISLKKNNFMGLNSIKKLKKYYNQTHIKMNEIGDEMNRVFSNI